MVINRRHITLIIFLLLSLSGISQHAVIANVASSRAVAGSSFDTDAQAFFTATAISNATQQNAVNTLVLALKSAGIWTKAFVIYPVVGGTATTHKFNLKDPRDLDAAFRLVFTGTITHSATGMLGNGSTGFGNTKFTPSSSGFTTTSGSYGFWSRTSAAATTENQMGSASASAEQTLNIRYTGNLFGANFNNQSSYPTFTNSTTVGWFMANRTSGNTEGYINGSRVITTAQTAALSTQPMYILAANNAGTAAAFTVLECTFIWIGQALTTTEEAALYNAINTYETALSR